MSAKKFAGFVKKQLDKSVKLSTALAGHGAQLAAASVEVTQTLIVENLAAAKSVTQVRDVAGLVELQRQLAQPLVKATAALAENAYTAADGVKKELGEATAENIAEIKEGVGAVVGKVVEIAPDGLKDAVAAGMSRAEVVLGVAAMHAHTVKEDFVKAATEAVEAGIQAAKGPSKPKGKSKLKDRG